MDDPKQTINRFVEELWNQRRLDVADAIFAKDCVTHQHRVVQEKIVEDWVLVEFLGFFQQLGIVPNTADLVARQSTSR